MNNDISIIIAVDNNFELVDNFFSHLFNLQLDISNNIEYVVVVDFCRDIKTIKYLKNLDNKMNNFTLRIIENRVGYAIANNIGVENSKYKHLLFINTDVFPEKKAIEKLSEYLYKNVDVGCVQGLLLYPQTHKVQSTGHIFTDYLNRHALKNSNQYNKLVQQTQQRQALTSAFYMIPKNIYDIVGGMDEFFFNAYDGMELSLRISNSGYKCIYYHKSIAFHATGGSRNFIVINEEQQVAYFWVKWFSKIKIDLNLLLKKQLNTKILNETYFVIDYGKVNLSWDKTLKNIGFIYDNIYIVDPKLKENSNFIISLPKSFQQTNMPLLFVCDEYTHIINNKEWFNNRTNKNDIILDIHGNVILPHSRIN